MDPVNSMLEILQLLCMYTFIRSILHCISFRHTQIQMFLQFFLLNCTARSQFCHHTTSKLSCLKPYTSRTKPAPKKPIDNKLFHRFFQVSVYPRPFTCRSILLLLAVERLHGFVIVNTNFMVVMLCAT